MNWTTISRKPNYEVNELGDVRNKITGRTLSGGMNNSGYRTVHISHTDNPEFVHRLVAETFVYNDDPATKTDINHIDGNKLNNRADNLEWTTRSANVKHAYSVGLNRPSGGGHNKRAICVLETGNVYNSQEECARAIGGSIGGVSMAINGKRRKATYKGYHLKIV